MAISKNAIFAPDKLHRFITQSLHLRVRVNRAPDMIVPYNGDFVRLIEKIARPAATVSEFCDGKRTPEELREEGRYEDELHMLIINANDDLGYLVDSFCDAYGLADLSELADILIAMSIRAHLDNGLPNPMVHLHSELVNFHARLKDSKYHPNLGIANQIGVPMRLCSWIPLISMNWDKHSGYIEYPIVDESCMEMSPQEQYLSHGRQGNLWDTDSMYGRLHVMLLEFLISETDVTKWTY